MLHKQAQPQLPTMKKSKGCKRGKEKRELTEFEKKVCSVFSRHYIFSKDNIREAYKQLRALDKLLFAIEMATMFNISLDAAVKIEKKRQEEIFYAQTQKTT